MDYIDFLLHGCGKKKDRELLKCERKADPPLTSRPPPGRASAAAAAAGAAAIRRAGERTNTTTSSIAERKTAAASGGRRGGEGRCSRDQAFPETASSTREVTTGRKEEEKLRRDVAAEWRRERMKELLCVLRRANRSGQTIDSSLQKHIIELSALKEQPHRFPEREILDQLVRERLQQKSSLQPDKIAHLSKEHLSLQTQQIPTPSHRLCSSSSVLCSSSASSSTSSSLSASCVSTSTNSSSLFSRGKSDNLNAAREQQLASAEDLQQQLQERRQQLLRLQAKQERERALAAATAAIDCASRRKKTRKKNITFFMPVAGRVGGLFYTPAATSLQRNSGCYNSSRSQCTAGAKPYNSFSALANSSSRHADPYSGSFTPPLKISVFSPKQQQQQQHRRATPAATEGRVKAKKQEEIEKEEEYINSSHRPAAPLRRTLDRQYIIRSKHTHVTTYNHNSSRKSSNSSRSGTSSSTSNDSSSTNDSSSSNSNDSSTLLKGVNGIPRPAKRWVGRKLVVERRTGESTVVYNPFKNAREGTAAAQAAATQAATATAATTPAETAAAAVVDVGGDENEEEEEEEEVTRHIREKREKRERTPSVCSAAWKTAAAHPATPPRAVAAARIAAGTAASPAGSGAGRAARTVVAAAAASSGEGSDSSTTAEAAVSGMKTGEWLAAGGGAAAAEKVTPAAAATAAASATAALKRKGKSKQRDHRRLVGTSETKGTRKEAIEQMKDEQQIRREQGCVVRARGAAVIVEERNIEEDLQSTAAEASCLPNGVGAAGGNIISCIATSVAKDITFPQIENRERTEKVDNLVLNSVVAEAAAGERERCFTSSCYSVSASAKAGAAASTLLTTVPSFLAAANRAHLLTSLKSAAPEAGAVEALAGAAGGERASQAGTGELPETIVMTAQVITAEAAAAAATEAVAEEAVAKTATALVEEATEATTAIAEAVPAKRAAAEAMSAETAATDSQAAVFEVTATKAIAAEEAIAAESGGAEAVAAEIIAAAAAPEATAATLRVVFQSSENVSCGSLQAATSLFSAHGGAAAEKPVFIASPISGIKKTKGQIEDRIVTAAETNAYGHPREEAAGGPMSCPAASTVFPPSARDIYTPAVKAASSVYRQAKRQISPAEGGKAEEQEDTAGEQQHHIEQQQQQQKKLGLSEQQQQHFLSYTSLHEQTQQTNEQQIQQQVQDPKLTGSVLSARKQQQQEHQQQEQRQQQQTERPEQPEQQHEEPHEWKQQHEQQQQQRLPQHQQQQQDSRQEQEEGEEEVQQQQQEQQEEQQREREKIIFSFLEAHRSHQQEEHIHKHPEKRNVDISSLHQKRPPLSSWSPSVSQQWSCSSPTHEHQQLQLARAAQQVIPSTVTCSPSEHHHHQQQKTSSVGSVMLEQGAVPVAAASPPPPIVLAPVPDHSAAACAAAVLVESVATCAAVAPDVAVQDGDSISAVSDLVLAGANAAVTPLHAQQTVMPTKNKKLVLQQGPYLAASSPPMLLPLPGTAERAIAAKEEVKKSNLQASGVSNVTQCLSFSSLVSGSNARNKSLLPSQGQVEKAFSCGDEKRAQSCCTVDMNAEEQPQQQQAAATAPLFAVSSSSSVSSAPLDSHVVRDSSTAVQQLISTNKEVAASRGDVTATTTTSNRGSSTAAAHDKASSSTADSSLLAEDRSAGAADDSPAADRSVGVTSVNDASSAALAVASLAAFFKSTTSPDAACLPAPVATVKSSPTASSTERFGLPALPEKAADPAAAYSPPPPAAAPDASAASTPSPTRAGIVPRSAAASVTTLPQAAASATTLPLSAVASVASLPSSAAASAASLPPRPAAACAASPLPSPAVSGASLPSRPAAASCAASLPSPDADSAARPSLHVSPASLPRPEAASAASAAAHFRLGTAVTTPVAGASSSVSLPPHSAAKSPAPLPRRAAVSASTTTPPRHAAACGRGGLRLPASAGRSLPHVAAACTPSPTVPCVSMSSAAGGMPAGKPPSPGKAQTPLTAAAARRANVCDSETRPNHPLVYSARAASRRIREEQEAASESRKRRKLLSEVSCKEKTATSEGFVRKTEVSVKGNTSPEEKNCGERLSLKEKGQLGTTQHSTTCQQLQSEQPQQQQVRQHTNSHKRQQQLNLPPSTARSGTRKISPAAQTIDFLDAVLDKSATVPFLPVGLQQQPSRQQQRKQQKQRLQPRESQRVSRQEQQPAEQIENVRGSRCVAAKTRVDTGIFTCLASALNAAAVVHTESGSSSTTTGSPTRHRSNVSSLVTNNTFFADSRGAMLVTTAKIQRGGARSGPGKTELDSVRAKSGLSQEPLLRAHSTKLSHNAPVARGAAGNPPFTPVKHRQTSIPGASADCADSAGGCEAEIKTSGQMVRYHNINIGDGLSAARSSSCVFSKRGALSSGTASRLHVASALPMKRNSAGGRNVSHLENTHVTTAVHSGAAIARRRDLAAANLPLRTAAGGSCEDRPRKEFCSGFTRAVAPPQAGTPCSMQTRFPPGERREDKKRMSVPFELSQRRFCPSSIKQPHNKNNTPAARLDRHSVAHRHESGASLALKVARKQKAKSASIISEDERSVDEEDEWSESDYDFIDNDTENVTGEMEENNWQEEMRTVTRYDPRNYRDLDAEECEESNFDRVYAEELFSSKVGQREDDEEMQLQQLKLEKSRHKKRKKDRAC